MDFEASGFGASSYPIEVGYCLSNGERFCTLIRPADGWTHWEEEAEQLHGISRTALVKFGVDVKTVALELNRRLEGQTLYSDGWVLDKDWLNLIFAVARVYPRFELRAIEHIQTECQYLSWDKVRRVVFKKSTERRHRASVDAHLIQMVYEQTLSLCSKEP